MHRNAVWLTTIFAGAFAFEMCVTSAIPLVSYRIPDQRNRAFDTTSNKIWDTINRGVGFVSFSPPTADETMA